MRSAPQEPARVERAFVGAYGAAGSQPLSFAVGVAGPSTARSAGELAAAWTGPHAPAPLSAGRIACLLDGEIHNLGHIAGLAQVPVDQAPEATLAAAYARVGDRLIGQLRGEFALLLWDARAKTGLLARDQLGSGNIFVHSGTGRLLFASELRNLLSLLPRTPPPDRHALVHWLAAGAVPASGTLYEGIVPLPPAHLMRLRGGRWETVRYWAPTYVEPRCVDIDGAAEALRRAVFGAVGRRLEGRRSAGVLISGGLDSGSVLAVADRLVGGTEASLHSYSAVFPAHPAMDESRLIGMQADHHDLATVQWPVTGGSPLRSALRYLDSWRVPLPVPGHFIWEPLLRAAARDGTECMLDGELGDELFGAAMFLLADRIGRGRVRSAVELARSFPGVGSSPRRRVLMSLVYHYGVVPCLPRALPRLVSDRQAAPAWLLQTEARQLRRSGDDEAWRGLDGPRWWTQLADAITRGPDRLGFFDYFRRRGRDAGIPAQHPFLDLDLIELVLRLPPEHGFDRDLSRPVLRRAMRGIMRDEVRLRRDKTYFDPLLVDCIAGEDESVVRDLLDTSDAEVWSLADRGRVRALLDNRPSRKSSGAASWMRDVWRLATAECWLRSQADASFPRTVDDQLSQSVNGRTAVPRRAEKASVSHP